MSTPVMIAICSSLLCSLSLIWRSKDKSLDNNEEVSGTQKFLSKGWILVMLFGIGLLVGLVSGMLS